MTHSTTELRRLWAPPCKGPWAKLKLYGGGSVTVRPVIVEAVRALDACLRHQGYEATPPDCGAYNCRHITNGTGYSLHAYGIALDINWLQNPYGHTLHTDMPAAMRDAIKGIRTNGGARVWGWGGDYGGNKDAMHWEIIASPQELASGIDQRTVPGGKAKPAGRPVPAKATMQFTQIILNAIRKTWPGYAQIREGGAYDDQAKAAIKEFQVRYNAAFGKVNKLPTDGYPDPRTMDAIGWTFRHLPKLPGVRA